MASQGDGELQHENKSYMIQDLRTGNDFHLSMESSPTLLNVMAGIPSCLWSCSLLDTSHRLQEVRNNSVAEDRVLDNGVALTDELNMICNTGSNSERVNEKVEQLVPAIDMIKTAHDLSQFQDSISMAEETGAAKSAISTYLGGVFSAPQLCYPHVSRSYMNQFHNFEESDDTLQSNMQDQSLDPGLESIESMDCLLSVTNSNMDTSVDDDGISSHSWEIQAPAISMGFSDWRSLWNLGGNGAVSSGESENNGETKKGKFNEQDQARSSQFKRKGFSVYTPSPPKKTERGVNHLYFHLLQQDSSTKNDSGFKLITENPAKPKKPKSEKHPSNINFLQPNSSSISTEPDTEAIASMKEMIYRAAAFRPVNLGFETVDKPKRKNVRISSDPQTAAARQRRERISDRIRVLQRLVPGGTKMDTASMLDEAANYLKFLRSQVLALESLGHRADTVSYCNSSWSTQTLQLHPFNNSNSNHYPMQAFLP